MTISVSIVADSTGPDGQRVTTALWRYPKFIHGEVMTHRVFSRNASSSRAIPVERLIADVLSDPVYPSYWGANQPGMQAGAELDADVEAMLPEYGRWRVTQEGDERDPRTVPALATMAPVTRTRDGMWDEARQLAVEIARGYARAGYHKQIVNRILEPFCHINVVVTSVEWENFFTLRCHPAAQPEIRVLAESMRTALLLSLPRLLRPGEWHLPFVEDDELEGRDWELLVRLSVARCARTSYLTQDGRVPTRDEDLKLYDRLVGSVPLHASPAEHQAMPDPTSVDYPNRPWHWMNPHLHGNLTGFIQNRKLLEQNLSEGRTRSDYEALLASRVEP